MKFRDAWNVWRRKVDKALEGQTGEISGKDVSFEGTGISATNVEDAINEVNGTVGTLSSDVTTLIGTVGDSNSGLVKDVDDLETALGDYQIVGLGLEMKVTADGVKTYTELLYELETAMKNMIDNLASNEFILETRFTIYGTMSGIPKMFIYPRENEPYTFACINVGVGSSDFTVTQIHLTQITATYRQIKVQTDGTITSINNDSVVPASGKEIGISYNKYKKVKP